MQGTIPKNPFLGQPITFCMKCGLPLKQHEIALRVKDPSAVDYESRGEFHDIVFYYCSQCKEQMLRWYSDGIRGAAERQKEIEERVKKIDEEDGMTK